VCLHLFLWGPTTPKSPKTHSSRVDSWTHPYPALQALDSPVLMTIQGSPRMTANDYYNLAVRTYVWATHVWAELMAATMNQGLTYGEGGGGVLQLQAHVVFLQAQSQSLDSREVAMQVCMVLDLQTCVRHFTWINSVVCYGQGEVQRPPVRLHTLVPAL
jgi:hypothetical protein